VEPRPGVDVAVVGDVMVDVSVASPPLARGGDVHGSVRLRPGGSGANAAVWAAHAGARVRLHGRVGADLAGRLLREEIVARGVEPALAVDPAAPTGTMLVVRSGGERSMVADRGANDRLEPGDLPARFEARAVLVSGYLVLGEGSREAALAALERAAGAVSAVDAASWPLLEAFGPDRFLEAVARADLLFANEHEARVLAGPDPEAAARRLAQGRRGAFVKLGARGAVGWIDGTPLRQGVEPVPDADATGAGDAFDGALLAALARGAPPGEALRRGCRAGRRVAASGEPWP
jgi:ribokinase